MNVRTLDVSVWRNGRYRRRIIMTVINVPHFCGIPASCRIYILVEVGLSVSGKSMRSVKHILRKEVVDCIQLASCTAIAAVRHENLFIYSVKLILLLII